MQKEGFVYIWYDSKRKMYYVGCHWGHEDDGYICSSKRMYNARRYRPHDFKRRVIKRGIPREQLLSEEFRWLSMIRKEELGKKYYNHHNHHFDHWSSDPKKVQEMRERNLGPNNPAYGKPGNRLNTKHTEEAKQKIREKRAKQVITEEHKKAIRESHLGEKNPFFGRKHSEESRQRMSESAKRRWSK